MTPVHKRYKSCIFTSHAYPPHLSMPYAGSTAHARLDIKTGSGRVIQSLLVYCTTLYIRHEAILLLVAMARGVCALESSCFLGPRYIQSKYHKRESTCNYPVGLKRSLTFGEHMQHTHRVENFMSDTDIDLTVSAGSLEVFLHRYYPLVARGPHKQVARPPQGPAGTS